MTIPQELAEKPGRGNIKRIGQKREKEEPTRALCGTGMGCATALVRQKAVENRGDRKTEGTLRKRAPRKCVRETSWPGLGRRGRIKRKKTRKRWRVRWRNDCQKVKVDGQQEKQRIPENTGARLSRRRRRKSESFKKKKFCGQRPRPLKWVLMY